MKYLLIVVLLFSSAAIADYDKEVTQFHDSVEEGLRITNTSLLPRVIYARFLIPGLNEEELRNSGTMQTLYPKQEIVFYLPVGTRVVATDGIYWDNPEPTFPEERSLVTIQESSIIELSAKDFNFE